ncbi:MAG: sulfite exporter TauE/SafE family protein [Lactobacillaceae bacterium]|jgi:uncharacterized membrane protein YfcA|nr:sulfite exporter TauE/SafE family protein [Lactobacillaceae bacterium]
MEIFGLMIVGILAGILGSILGLGGGILVTPILVIGFNLPIHYAIPISIIAVIGTSTGSSIAYLKDDLLNVRIAMFLEIFTSIGALVGAVLTGIFAPQYLNFFFGALLVYQGYNMYQKIRGGKADQLAPANDKIANYLRLDSTYYDQKEQKEIHYYVENVPLGSAIMFGAGFASGLLGIGSGSFKVFALDSAMKMPLKASSATSNFMMGVTAAASALIYFFQGMIKFEIVVPIVIGIIVGSTLGAKIMPKLNNKVIRIIFIPVVLLTGLQLVLKAFGITLY